MKNCRTSDIQKSLTIFRMAQESGRTLIEMLSMLAIMGILAMVGIKGYTYAITKHKANELVYEAQ